MTHAGGGKARTLVVETTNFNDKRRFQGSTKDVRLVERFTRIDNDTISYRLTVTDPQTYSQPWTLENTLWRSDEPIFEYGVPRGELRPRQHPGRRARDRDTLMTAARRSRATEQGGFQAASYAVLCRSW